MQHPSPSERGTLLVVIDSDQIRGKVFFRFPAVVGVIITFPFDEILGDGLNRFQSARPGLLVRNNPVPRARALAEDPLDFVIRFPIDDLWIRRQGVRASLNEGFQKGHVEHVVYPICGR